MYNLLLKIDALFQKFKIYSLLGIFLSLIPKSRKIIFTSYPNYSDSVLAFYQFMVAQKANNRMIWIDVRGESKTIPSNIESYNFLSLKGLYHFLTAKVIFTNNNEFFRIKASNQVLIDFWHGIPLKNILNYDNALDIKLLKHAYRTDYRISSSKLCTMLLSSAFGNSMSEYIETGYPRTDLVLSDNNEDFLKKLNIDKGKKILLYMPTYRAGYRNKSDGDYSYERLYESDNFKKYCKSKNIHLIVKLHPFERHESGKYDYYSIYSDDDLIKVGLCSSNLLSIADNLITDYSSVAIDFLATRKPLFFYVPDLSAYHSNRGFIFDVNSIFDEATFTSVDDLIIALQNQFSLEYTNKMEIYSDLFFNFKDTDNSHRLFIWLTKKYPKIFLS